MIKYRDYQQDAIDSVWAYFNKGNTGNPVIAMPTGTGKSVVIAGFIKSVFDSYPTQRLMMLTHVKELIEQNFEKLLQVWPMAPAGIYSSGLNRRDIYNNITFAGIGSVVNRAHEFGHIDLILVDECHLVSPSDDTMYQKFINDLKEVNPYLKVIGLTATPYRLGHGRIIEEGSLFTDLCIDMTTLHSFNWFVNEGYLAPLVPKNTSMVLNVDGVSKRAGEFVMKHLQTAVDKYELTEAAVKECLEVASDRKSWLVFTAGVEHAVHTAEILNAYGVSAVAVHGGNKTHKMTSAQRDQAINDFKEGKIQALVNNNVLTTGFDHPPIDLIVMLRPTSSPGLWVQMLGRGTRPVYADGFDLTTTQGRLQAIEMGGKKDCLVLDFGGNTRRLGPINDPLLPPKKGKGGTGEAPIKLCEAINNLGKVCNSWIHASVKFCPECGNEFVFKTNLKQSASTDEIMKIDAPQVETFAVSHITYSEHNKEGRPPMIKVTYYCGFQMFTEYVCLEHTGFALHKAKKWWQERTTMPVPTSTAQALSLCGNLRVCTHLRVWVNKKYPEIMAHCYDGTDFGTKEASRDIPTIEAPSEMPVKETHVSPKWHHKDLDEQTPPNSQSLDDFDEWDDIPF